MEPAIPSEEDREVAQTTSRLLSAHVGDPEGLRFRLPESRKRETVHIPQSALRLLVEILSQMANGNAVTLIPIHAELTTQEAADILNVSRPFLVKLIKERKVPARKVGTHRRVLFADLMRYKQTTDRDRMKALDELTKQAQDLGLGY
jgi:excisionase family DNA binding protein